MNPSSRSSKHSYHDASANYDSEFSFEHPHGQFVPDYDGSYSDARQLLPSPMSPTSVSVTSAESSSVHGHPSPTSVRNLLGSHARPELLPQTDFVHRHRLQSQPAYIAPASWPVESFGGPGAAAFTHGGDAQNQDSHVQYEPAQSLSPSASNLEALDADITNEFRFLTILHTKTALLHGGSSIPDSYLNKGQAYMISIKDTAAEAEHQSYRRYRTHIRISFDRDYEEDEKATLDPWKMWTDGRAAREHARHAVEFVNSRAARERNRIELENQSLDGFAIVWTPNADGLARCQLHVRFNFLSTDFTQAKGVSGRAVRLCSKTEIINPGPRAIGSLPQPEICYCKVKVFRDHGAERKLLHDKNRVAKKMSRSMKRLEDLRTSFNETTTKRSRSDSDVGTPSSKSHRSETSESPQHSLALTQSGNELIRDLEVKVETYEATLHSYHEVTVFRFQGDGQDDPDRDSAHSEPFPSANLSSDMHSPSWPQSSATGSTYEHGSEFTSQSIPGGMITPSSLASQPISPAGSLHASTELKIPTQTFGIPQYNQNIKPRPVQHESQSSEGNSAVQRIPRIQRMTETRQRPSVCFYIKPSINGIQPNDDHYRAVYAQDDTLKSFVDAVARKLNLDSENIENTLFRRNDGLIVKVDDDFMRRIKPEQAMFTDIRSIDGDNDGPYTLMIRF